MHLRHVDRRRAESRYPALRRRVRGSANTDSNRPTTATILILYNCVWSLPRCRNWDTLTSAASSGQSQQAVQKRMHVSESATLVRKLRVGPDVPLGRGGIRMGHWTARVATSPSERSANGQHEKNRMNHFLCRAGSAAGHHSFGTASPQYRASEFASTHHAGRRMRKAIWRAI
eukprot:Polyplicarium_translucidae@DN4839_c0_g1_i1.p2